MRSPRTPKPDDAAGRSGPAHFRFEGGSSIRLDDLISALNSIPATKANKSGLSPVQVARIEDRIAGGASAEPSDLDLSSIFSKVASATLVRDEEEIDLESFVSPSPAPTEAKPSTKDRGKRILRKVIAAAIACVLALGTIGYAVSHAEPGSFVYGLKVRAESARVALSTSDLQRAEALLGVASTRFSMIQSGDLAPKYVPQVLAEMDSAQARAVDALMKVETNASKMAVASALNGLAHATVVGLEALKSGGESWLVPSFDASIRNALRVIAETELMLYPPSGASSPDPVIVKEVAGARPSRRTGSSQQRPAVNQSTNSSTGTGTNTNPTPIDTQPECDASAGNVCLRAGELPPIPQP